LNCIVTAGPTYETLDQVRRLTNFSTGRLGSELAEYLTAHGHTVVLLKGYYAVHALPAAVRETVTFTTTADLRSRLQTLANAEVDAVFHAAAVSDFTFGKVFVRSASGDLREVQEGKFSTRAGPLLAELVPTPKIVAELRQWYSRAWLVGWKYEVDGGRAEAIAAGSSQLQRCDTNACVLNGPAYGDGFGFLDGSGCLHLPERQDLFACLEAGLRRWKARAA
jgi:phosphopantothenate---cysteine ligase (CTP)